MMERHPANDVDWVVVASAAPEREELRQLLTQTNLEAWQVVHASTLTEGMASVSETARCVAILDLFGPSEGAAETVAEFHRAYARIPLIVLAGREHRAVATDCLRAGALDYLCDQELHPDMVARTIRHAAERQAAGNELRQQRESLEELVTRRTAELRTTNEMLEGEVRERREAERLKEDFVSTVSHELRTPLSVIKEAVGLLSDSIPGPLTENQANVLAIAGTNVERLERLINDLLDVAKLESGRMELDRQPLEFRDLISQLSASMAPSVDAKELSFRVDVGAEPLPIEADPDRIMEVLMNLLDNAIKFTPHGMVRVWARQVEDEVWCSIEDTGEGIATEDVPRLFRKFSQVGKHDGDHTSGTGLGLCIARDIVKLHNGRTWVESELGRGSCFTFSLPIFPSPHDMGEKMGRDES